MKFKENIFELTAYDFQDDFVAITAEVDEEMFCKHSGLIISFEEKIFYFHFTGVKVELVEITDDLVKYNKLYFKKLDIILEDDVVSFLGHCEKLQRKGVHPLYGFVFNDSYYDSSKLSYLTNSNHDITTCVGFCIKIIRGFIYNNSEYIKINDWSSSSVANVPQWLLDHIEKFLTIYATENNLTVDQLFSQDELKRILPSELLSSAFFQNLPIPKSQIDSVRPSLELYIKTLRVA
jgi:hypothetical protein